MTSKKTIETTFREGKQNPFKVPEGYFDDLDSRVLDKIRLQEQSKRPARIYLRPYFAVAASISGLALIIYIVLQSVTGPNMMESDSYDLAVLDNAGIILDESVVAEAYNSIQPDKYSDWEKEAMTLLASNEVDLLHLLESN